MTTYTTQLHVERPIGHLPFAYRLIRQNTEDPCDWEEIDSGTMHAEAWQSAYSAADEVYEYDCLVAGTAKARVK